MKRALLITAGVAALLVLVAARRPPTEFQLMSLLNGQPTRWILPDAGVSGMYGTGQQCMSLTGVPSTVIELVPNLPINVCVRPETNGYGWDGGCNTIVGDMNFGVPVQPYVPFYVVVGESTTTICQTGDGGSTVTPVWALQ